MISYRSSFSIILLIGIAIIAQGAKLNMCDWIRCENKGTCQEVENSTIGFRCRCSIGFNGTLCESRVNITACGTNPCLNNAACSITSNRTVKCTCPKSYTGSRCETKINK